MSRRAAVLLVAAVGAITAVGVVSRGAAVGAESNTGPPVSARAPRDYWISEYRRRWRLERRDGRARAVTIRALRRSLRAVARQPYGNHPLEHAFLCIHGHEGRWNDSGAPYWGGLQMDRDFQVVYGRPFLEAFGTADRWPVSVQLAVAIRAWTERGFNPWPNTRRMCGL